MFVLVFSLTLVLCLGSASSGKVLVWPADNSHWINLKSIMDELTARGHQVTVLVPTSFQIIDRSQPSPFHLEVFTVPFSKADMETWQENFLHVWVHDYPDLSFWEFFSKFLDLGNEFFAMNKIICGMVVFNEELLKKLQSTGFDVLVADPLLPCGELVAEKLRVPFVYSYRFSAGNTLERLCGGLPAPPSYVPASMLVLTDRISFTERMKNMLFYISQDLLFHQIFSKDLNQYYSDVLGRPTTLCETAGKAEFWLIRTYWDFEFPRPLLPNFEFVGGLHCQPAKPLPEFSWDDETLYKATLDLSDLALKNPRQKRHHMKTLLRVSVYCILRYTESNFLYDLCQGCLIQAPGQLSHDCLFWDEEFKREKLREVCSQLCLVSVLNFITVVAYALNCLFINGSCVDQVQKLITDIEQAADPENALVRLLNFKSEQLSDRLRKIVRMIKPQYFLRKQ